MGKLNWGRRVYGIVLICLTTAIASPAQTLTTLHSFDRTDGANPSAALVQATNGNLYGTTNWGGARGQGTVFKITPSGKLTTLHTFTGTDGSHPTGALVQAADGDLYGTTYEGGDNGLGTVFKITPRGKLTTLHSFEWEGYPTAALIQATNGNLYGTTFGGWDDSAGTVFGITLGGKLTTLHSFTGGTDGSGPTGALVQAADGDLYGTTNWGGARGKGTVFKITPSGDLTTLHSFTGTDSSPNSLIQAADGNLYGTTYGGWFNDYGTVFKITLSGELTTLYRFCSQNNCTDGSAPAGVLVQATDGNLYGTTSSDGGFGNYDGTVFEITIGGKLKTLYRFTGPDGAIPLAGLVQATDGNLYGTTDGGGANGLGTVFRLALNHPDTEPE